MSDLNRVLLIGNLGRDPEIRTSESGTCICQIRLATREWRSGFAGEKSEPSTEWHNVVAFGRLAEIGRDHLQKGQKVFVEGRIRTRSYQKENAQTQWYTEIVASDIRFLDRPQAAEESRSAPDADF